MDAASWRPSPASRACQDVMQCVFAFLTLTELVQAARCCTPWDRWAVKAFRRKDKVTIYDPTQLETLADSRLLHHVTEVESVGDCCVDMISHLAHATNVTSMDVAIGGCSLPWNRRSHVSFQLPSSITNLTLNVSGCLDRVLLEEVSTATSLQSLTLNCDPEVVDTFYLPPDPFRQLSRLPNLTSFEIHGDVHITISHVHEIKQLASLRCLDMFNGSWSDDEFRELCSPPHALRNLQDINLQSTDLNRKNTECLRHFPTLTKLHTYCIETDAFPVLARFLPPACTDLTINAVFGETITMAMCSSLDLSRIQTLYLERIDLSSDDAVTFLNERLPSLTNLRLWRCPLPSDPSRLHMPRVTNFTIHGLDEERFVREQFTGLVALRSFVFRL